MVFHLLDVCRCFVDKPEIVAFDRDKRCLEYGTIMASAPAPVCVGSADDCVILAKICGSSQAAVCVEFNV